ncbi:MAG TPA: hypothetical protein VF832_19580 [Longimicrobiales bacterium]
MRTPGAILLVPALMLTAACTDTLPREAAGPTAPLSALADNAGSGDLTEPAAFNGRICELRFTGTPSPTAEFFAIWNLGHGILDVPFDTPRPDLYAILPGTMHRVPGYPQLDHDHIVSAGPGVVGYDGTWDVWVVVPGPAFNPATYQAPRAVADMFALINQHVLAGPIGFAQAGFGRDLVLRAPLVCTAGA